MVPPKILCFGNCRAPLNISAREDKSHDSARRNQIARWVRLNSHRRRKIAQCLFLNVHYALEVPVRLLAENGRFHRPYRVESGHRKPTRRSAFSQSCADFRQLRFLACSTAKQAQSVALALRSAGPRRRATASDGRCAASTACGGTSRRMPAFVR